MKERPILFSDAMVRAILQGQKTQTRRIIRHPINQEHATRYYIEEGRWWCEGEGYAKTVDCPYGGPGDRLWVREAWRPIVNGVAYRATSPFHSPTHVDHRIKWKPSIFMKREACRLLLEITSVKVERLQDISEEDAKAEGIYGLPHPRGCLGEAAHPDCEACGHLCKPILLFQRLWDRINGKRASWESNPWLWVVSFKKIEAKL